MRLRGLLWGILLLLPSSAWTEVDPEIADKGTIKNVYELEQLHVDQQYKWLPVAPPSLDVYTHSFDMMVPIQLESFPKKFQKALSGELDSNGYPLYSIRVYEDPATRNTVFANADGSIIYELLPEENYNPYEWQELRFDLATGEVLDPMAQWLYDPAHVASRFVLIPSEYYESYTLNEEVVRVAEEQLLAMQPMAMSMTAPLNFPTGLYMEGNLSGTPEESYIDLFGLTGSEKAEFYIRPNLQYYHWTLAEGDLSTDNGTVRWINPRYGQGRNQLKAFFQAGSSLDSDGDGLSDAFEMLAMDGLSSPTNAYSLDAVLNDGEVDSDGDGLTNEQEYRGGITGISTSPRRSDTDYDGYSDAVDLWPLDKIGALDYDEDGFPKRINSYYTSSSYPPLVTDLDDDNDGFSDTYEAQQGLDSTDPNDPGADALLDTDGDGLVDWREAKLRTNPLVADSDGDGIDDGYEILVLSSDPDNQSDVTQAEVDAFDLVKGDTDSDGRPDWLEVNEQTNPMDRLDFGTVIY